MGIIDVSEWNANLKRSLLAQGFEVSSIAEVGGIPIEGFYKSAVNLEGPLVYVSSGVHGDEPAGPLAIAEMAGGEVFSDTFNWLVCPMLNPSGHLLGTRENGEGVDLNRDYYHRKSEEVDGHVEWLERHPVPDLMLSLHEDWESTGYYFYEINIREDAPSRAESLMRHLDQFMQREPEPVVDDHEVRQRGWIYHEAVPDEFECWPEAIYMARAGCPVSLTMETPSSTELEKRVELQVEFVCKAVQTWF